MLRNAFAYITRKPLKSAIIALVVLVMTTLALVSVAVQQATLKAQTETYGALTNSFTMEINRRVNQGTARGGGNVRGQDIAKINRSQLAQQVTKRINSVADVVDLHIVETPQTKARLDKTRAERFGRAVMLTGVNDSSKETKFATGAFRLVEGEHLSDSDTYQILMHKDFAEKNNLHVGDTITLASNIYDADNAKGAHERFTVRIKGLFDGHNAQAVSAAQELYETTFVTDLSTAARVYGYTEDTALYQDATFSVAAQKNLDDVLKELKRLNINWNMYHLVKSSDNYPALQQSIQSLFKLTAGVWYGSLAFTGIVVALLLFLWINARRHEVAVLLSVGKSKVYVWGQFLCELLMVSIPAFIVAFFCASASAQVIGNALVARMSASISNSLQKAGQASGLGAGAEADGFNKTLDSLSISLDAHMVAGVVLFMSVVLVVALLLACVTFMRKSPRALLIDTN